MKGKTCLTLTSVISSTPLPETEECLCDFKKQVCYSRVIMEAGGGGGKCFDFKLNLELFSISCLVTNFLFSSFQRLQSFPA